MAGIDNAPDVGDEVIHPHHGPGVVIESETIDVGQGPTLYVVVELQDGMTIKAPADSLAEVGLREPVTETRADEVLAVLSEPAPEDPGHRIRRRRDTEKLASGHLIECAEVVRDLTAITEAHDKGGNYADIRMLLKAREQLAAELAVALSITQEEAGERIDEALAARA
jgi:CarD family transcriptional regulator